MESNQELHFETSTTGSEKPITFSIKMYDKEVVCACCKKVKVPKIGPSVLVKNPEPKRGGGGI